MHEAMKYGLMLPSQCRRSIEDFIRYGLSRYDYGHCQRGTGWSRFSIANNGVPWNVDKYADDGVYFRRRGLGDTSSLSPAARAPNRHITRLAYSRRKPKWLQMMISMLSADEYFRNNLYRASARKSLPFEVE